MHQASKISVVITTYNRPDALAAVVEACFGQDDDNFEIIIADDGSTNNTRESVAALRARSPVPLQYVWQPDEGFRAARVRNLGTLAASGEYIVFLDGDCIPARNFVSQHRRLARTGYLVSGSRVLISERYTNTLLERRIDLQGLGLGERLRRWLAGDFNKFVQTAIALPDLGRERRGFSWRRIKSCNLAVWRCDLERVNGFDESFTGWGHEDSDLVVRLFNAGILRKDGAFATEVYHLWHRENQRDQESSNRQVVQRRVEDGTVQATTGLRELATAA
jgi:glycosyltransferase involved in cell wall biosynthesis